MVMRSLPIRDAAGQIIGVACYREKRLPCATAGCRGEGTLLCDYPVTRRGLSKTCDRRVCQRCAAHVGTDLDYCPPHARVHQAECARRAEEDRFKALMAEFRPVGSDEPEEP
jgi:hypothetical protein